MYSNNSQSIDTAVNSVSKEVVAKITKRRGRACTRREKLSVSTAHRIVRDKLAASYSNKEFRRELKQFEKTVSEAAGRGIHDIPMPDFLAELKASATLAESNLDMAYISQEAMEKFPPLNRI